MNRVAKVIAQGNHSVTLQLQKTEKCAGCSSNCNQPLFSLFSTKNNTFTLNAQSSQYQLCDKQGLMLKKLSFGHPLKLSISDYDLYISSGFLYLLPLLLVLLFLTLGHVLALYMQWWTDLGALLGAITGFFVIYLGVKSKKISKYLKYRPKVTIFDGNGTND